MLDKHTVETNEDDFFNTEVEFGGVEPAEQFWVNDKWYVKTMPRVLEGGIFTNAVQINTPFVADFMGTDKVLIHKIPEDE